MGRLGQYCSMIVFFFVLCKFICHFQLKIQASSMADVLKHKGDFRQPDLRTKKIVMIILKLRIGKVVPSALEVRH